MKASSQRMGVVLACLFSLSCMPFIEGCGLFAVTGVAAALVVSDRRQADVILLDRSTQLNVKSVTNRLLHWHGHVEVTVYNGVVLLTGQVSTLEDKRRLERVIARIRSVRRLVSEVTISPELAMVDRARDMALTARVKAHLVEMKTPSPALIRIVTENKTVYLMGLLTREEAEQVSSRVRRVSGVEKVVEVFQIISSETADLLDGRYSFSRDQTQNKVISS